jgi:type IV secretion system protein VirB10
MSGAELPPAGGVLPGERNVSEIAGRRPSSFTGMRAVAVIATGAVVLVVLVFARNGQKVGTAHGPDYGVQQHVAFEPAPLPPAEPAVARPVVPSLAPAASAEPPGQLSPSQPADQGPSPLDKARTAPVMEFAGEQGTKLGDLLGTAESGPPQDSANTLAASLIGTKMIGSKASLLPHRNMLITMGTVIPCVLETAIDTTLPGFATCMTPRDALSDDSTVILMEKGTKIVGEFRGGVRQGQHRVFILWTRAETPNGVIIHLESPATDPVGRSGVDGVYDAHFWERFGGALMFSLVEDAGNIAAAGMSGSSGGNGSINASNFQPSVGAGQQAAAIALENTINIPPTIRKNQGEFVSLYVARDLDFSGVYDLRPIRGKPPGVSTR